MLQIHLFSLSLQRFRHFVRQIWTFCNISIDLPPLWWGAFPGRWIGGEICWCPKCDSRLECHTTSFRQGPRASQPEIHRRFQLQQQLHWRQQLTYGQTELLLLLGKVVGEAEMKDLEEMKASGSSSELRTIPRSFALCSPSHLSLSTVCVSSSASTSLPYSAWSPASKRKATSRHGTTTAAGACSLRHPSNAFASGFCSPDMHFFVPDLNLNWARSSFRTAVSEFMLQWYFRLPGGMVDLSNKIQYANT